MAKDRVELAIRSKSKVIDLDGRKLNLVKWPCRKGIANSARLFDKVREVGGKKLEDILQMDLIKFGEGAIDLMFEIVAQTIAPHNGFENDAAAMVWLDSLSMDEFGELFMEVIKQNLAPFLEVLGKQLGNSKLLEVSALLNKKIEESPPQI